MNVLITNAHTRMAHLCAKHLFREGHSVYAGDHGANSYVFSSRYIKGSFTYPSPYADQELFLDTIVAFLQAHQRVFLLPTYEETFLFSKHYKKIAPYCHCVIPQYEAILQVHNKWNLYQLARKLNLQIPHTVLLKDYIRDNSASTPITYPFVIKPRQGGGNWQLYVIKKTTDFYTALEKIRRANIEDRMLVQEFIPTDRKFSHAVVYNRGNQVAYFTDLHIRDHPSNGGAGCCRISIKDHAIEQMGKILFDHLQWNGVAEMEVVRHSTSGEFYLIEVNPRIWGGINSALLAGLNIPQILIEIAAGNAADDIYDYRSEIESRWLLGELRSMYGNIVHSPKPFRTLLDILLGFLHFSNFDEIDPADLRAMFSLVLSAIAPKPKKNQTGANSLQGEWK